MSLFPFITKKWLLLFQYYVKKNFNSLKKNIALMLIFCQKTSILSKIRRSHVIFFLKNCSHAHILSKKSYILLKTLRLHVFFLEFFIKNHNTLMPKSGQKNVNSVKTILSYGPKKSKGCPFFPDFERKSLSFHTHFLLKTFIV